MKKAFVAFGMLLIFVSCGGSSPIDPIVTPTPTPTPVATATPEPPEIACTPVPPTIYGFIVKIHDDQGWKKILDSRPQVRDRAYCSSVGYPGADLRRPGRKRSSGSDLRQPSHGQGVGHEAVRADVDLEWKAVPRHRRGWRRCGLQESSDQPVPGLGFRPG